MRAPQRPARGRARGSGPVWFGLILGGLIIGAIWGAIFGFVAHWATRGQRDFASVSGLVAGRYDLLVASEHAERARMLLTQVPSEPRAAVGGTGSESV